MTPESEVLDAIRFGHTGDHHEHCWTLDESSEGCEVAIVLAELDAAREALRAAVRLNFTDDHQVCDEQRRAAEADADRLAGALNAAIRYDGGPERRWQIARDVLAAHEATPCPTSKP